jgi:magnesium chelatase subunit I
LSHRNTLYPFSALVGQEEMQLALILNAINPSIGGVLIRGEKGTAKSTAVRGLANVLPEQAGVADCVFFCPPDRPEEMCENCLARHHAGEHLPVEHRKMRVVDLPINASEDRVVGTLDLEHALRQGEKRFEPGVLAETHRNILYVDEVNLLDDHIVDVLLDAAAMGVNIVEREGVSYTHPARFILVGTMNPEEGDLRPQLQDRFGLCVDIQGLKEPKARVEIVDRREAYEADPAGFVAGYAGAEAALGRSIVEAKERLTRVTTPNGLTELIAKINIALDTDGHRGDIVIRKMARTLAAFERRQVVSEPDVKRAAALALSHRLKRLPLEQVHLSVAQILAGLDLSKIGEENGRTA